MNSHHLQGGMRAQVAHVARVAPPPRGRARYAEEEYPEEEFLEDRHTTRVVYVRERCDSPPPPQRERGGYYRAPPRDVRPEARAPPPPRALRQEVAEADPERQVRIVYNRVLNGVLKGTKITSD